MGSILGYTKGQAPFVQMILRHSELHEMARYGYYLAMPRHLRVCKFLADALVRISLKLRRPIDRWEACNRHIFDKIFAALQLKLESPS